MVEFQRLWKICRTSNWIISPGFRGFLLSKYLVETTTQILFHHVFRPASKKKRSGPAQRCCHHRFPRLQLRRKTYDSISTLSGPTRSDFKQRVGETIFVSKKWTFFEKEDADSTIFLMSMKFINSKIPIKIMLEIQTKQQSRKSCQGNDNDDIWYYINQLEHAFWCQDKYDINSNSKGITCGFKQENPPVLSFRHQDEEGAEFPEGLTHFTQIRVSHEIKTSYFPLYWLVNRDPYNGSIIPI